MNIYCREYDDQTQFKIKRECKAIGNIFKLIEEQKYRLCGSFMLEFENNANTIAYQKIEIKTLFSEFDEYVKKEPGIMEIAKNIIAKSNTKTKDAVHLACAVNKGCTYFITCDNEFIKTVNNNRDSIKNIIGDIKIINPINFEEKEVLRDGK
jgi:predicted nucleic acid-binding protein